MNESKRDVIIKKAIEFEEEGKRFYHQAEQVTKSEAAKSMFRLLKEQEDLHIQILQEIRKELDATNQWPASSSLDWTELDFKQLFSEAISKVGDLFKATSDDMDALRVAQELEQKGIDLYQDFAARAGDTREKQIFARLADEERKHYDFIESFYSYFEDKGLRMDEG